MHHTQEINVNPHNKYRVQIRHEKIKIIEIIAYDTKGRTLLLKEASNSLLLIRKEGLFQ